MDKPLLDLYTDYLIASFGPTTATGLSALLEGAISHDKITRFLSECPLTSADLWQIVKPLVRKVQAQNGVLTVDDTIQEKPYTDPSDLICWHFDHSKDRLLKGINFLSALYQWFSSAQNMRFIRNDLDKHFVMPVKANRKVALSREDKWQSKYQVVESLDLEPGAVREVWLDNVDFPLLLVKQVFTNGDGSVGTLYLVTSDRTLDFEQITTLYQKRWKVEEYHKSLKQNASLAKSPTRTMRTQTNHLFCCLCAFVKLEALNLRERQSHFALKARLYTAALRSAFGEFKMLRPDRLVQSNHCVT